MPLAYPAPISRCTPSTRKNISAESQFASHLTCQQHRRVTFPEVPSAMYRDFFVLNSWYRDKWFRMDVKKERLANLPQPPSRFFCLIARNWTKKKEKQKRNGHQVKRDILLTAGTGQSSPMLVEPSMRARSHTPFNPLFVFNPELRKSNTIHPFVLPTVQLRRRLNMTSNVAWNHTPKTS